jgi:hypothetical protein
MRRVRRFVAAALVAASCQGVAAQEPKEDGDFFASPSVFTATLDAPLRELFDRGRRDPEFTVTGTFTYEAGNGRLVTVNGIQVGIRGSSSLQATECEFPKLRLKLPNDRPPPLRDVATLRIGTHCADRADGALTPKYGRWANEKAPHREAAVYRLIAAVNVPTLRARPARLTYITRDGRNPPLTRNAILLEEDERLLKRLGATGAIESRTFTSARDAFSPADAARLSFAQAMIGNFDWCLRFYPDDRYRCNDRQPLWNVLALRTAAGAVPAIQDFDLSGLVTGRHLWFDNTFTAAFSSTKSKPEVEVVGQLQRARRLFGREQLDATRLEFMRRKSAAYAAIAESPMDDDWRPSIHAYLDSFFEAIDNDERFYLPVVVSPGARFFLDAQATRPACGSDNVPVGTPVSEPLEVQDGKLRVVVLDAQWYWTTPRRCDVIRRQPVWIAASAVSRDFPR